MGREPRDLIFAVWGMDHRIKMTFFRWKIVLGADFWSKASQTSPNIEKTCQTGGSRGSQRVAGEPPRVQKTIDPMATLLIFGGLGLPNVF